MFLDTNVYSAFVNGNKVVDELIKTASILTLPLPVIAELRYGFAKGSRYDYNEQNLQRFLAQPQVNIATPTLTTTKYYATLQLLCKQQGRALSQNDIWIAALAQETNEILVTFDQDFTALRTQLGDKLHILSY